MDAHRIGVNDKRTVAAAHLHKAVLLLQPTEQQAQQNAKDGSEDTDQAPLEKEDAADLLVRGS